MARSFFLIAALVGSLAFAQHQNGGVWTGYVGGWKPNTSPGFSSYSQFPAATVWGNNFSTSHRQRSQVFAVPFFINTGVSVQQEQDSRNAAAEQAEQRRAWEAEQARQQLQAQVENERRVAAEREALFHQQLEAERRLSAEREALAQERLRLEREHAARLAVVLQPPPPPEPVRPEAPRTPGNDIYRWTDADGVVHYSTNVPDSAKASAKKVGGR
ncbi:MAG: DUF4124 domain-containing protein [Myxococcales bacterium]|nr:DUF4124 domain-containing protein [Myxococcales bacterium]